MGHQHANLIGGAWVEADRDAPNINPSNLADVVGDFAQGTAGQVAQAVAAAKEAQLGWRRATAQTRGDLLDKVGERLLARETELGTLLAREEGKTLAEAKGEVQRAARIFKYFAAEALRAHGEVIPSVRPNVTVETGRERWASSASSRRGISGSPTSARASRAVPASSSPASKPLT
ncbi:MAG: aldehyde dehydrogenase family protein [Rhodospirillaceae bacterium]